MALALVALAVVGALVVTGRDGEGAGGGEVDEVVDPAVREPARPERASGHRSPVGVDDGTVHRGSLGEPVRSGSGLSVVVEGAAVEADPGGRAELVIAVTLRNEGQEPVEYGFPAFMLEREGGRIDFPVPSPRDDALGTGALEPGRSVSGVVVFRTGRGSYVLTFDWIGEQRDPARWEFTV